MTERDIYANKNPQQLQRFLIADFFTAPDIIRTFEEGMQRFADPMHQQMVVARVERFTALLTHAQITEPLKKALAIDYGFALQAGLKKSWQEALQTGSDNLIEGTGYITSTEREVAERFPYLFGPEGGIFATSSATDAWKMSIERALYKKAKGKADLMDLTAREIERRAGPELGANIIHAAVVERQLVTSWQQEFANRYHQPIE